RTPLGRAVAFQRHRRRGTGVGVLVEQAGGGSTAGHSAWPVFWRNTARVAGAVPPPVLVLLGSISLQVGAAFAKEMFSIAGPAGVVTLRLVFAALILLVVWRPSVRLGRRAWVTVVCYGIDRKSTRLNSSHVKISY